MDSLAKTKWGIIIEICPFNDLKKLTKKILLSYFAVVLLRL